MDIQLELEIKEKLLAAEELSIKSQRELVTLVNTPYTKNTASLCNARDSW